MNSILQPIRSYRGNMCVDGLQTVRQVYFIHTVGRNKKKKN